MGNSDRKIPKKAAMMKMLLRRAVDAGCCADDVEILEHCGYMMATVPCPGRSVRDMTDAEKDEIIENSKRAGLCS